MAGWIERTDDGPVDVVFGAREWCALAFRWLEGGAETAVATHHSGEVKGLAYRFRTEANDAVGGRRRTCWDDCRSEPNTSSLYESALGLGRLTKLACQANFAAGNEARVERMAGDR